MLGVEANALAPEPPSAVLHAGAARACTDRGGLRKLHSFASDAPGGALAPRLGPLRVLDEVRLDPGEGDAARLQQDVEILLWVLEGALEHQDSAGNLAIVEPGELARLRAGRGVRHSTYNASGAEPLRLLEIWIQSATRGLAAIAGRACYAHCTRGALTVNACALAAGDALELHGVDGIDGDGELLLLEVAAS